MRLVLRLPWWYRLISASGYVAAAVGLAALVVESSLLTQVAAGAVCALLLAVAARLTQLRVEIDDQELLIVDWRRTRSYHLTDVRYFSWDFGWTAVMRDGRWIRADVFSPGLLGPLLADEAEIAARLCQRRLHNARRGPAEE